ncbi:UNVERIFIED_CONTAM: hypothetical protein FKN15_078336 [Acipenser sinensis]
MLAASVGTPTNQKMESTEELITRINDNTAAQKEQAERWRLELGLPEREPTELELLLQKWEQAREHRWLQHQREKPHYLRRRRRRRSCSCHRSHWLKGEEVSNPPPTEPQQQAGGGTPVLSSAVPCSSYVDTSPECLDLPPLDLVPRSQDSQAQSLVCVNGFAILQEGAGRKVETGAGTAGKRANRAGTAATKVGAGKRAPLAAAPEGEAPLSQEEEEEEELFLSPESLAEVKGEEVTGRPSTVTCLVPYSVFPWNPDVAAQEEDVAAQKADVAGAPPAGCSVPPTYCSTASEI